MDTVACVNDRMMSQSCDSLVDVAVFVPSVCKVVRGSVRMVVASL